MIHAARARALCLGGVALLATPTGAAPITFSGEASLDLGYAINPFLQAGVNDGAFSIGASIRPTLTSREANAETTLSGGYSRSEYLTNGFQPSESIGVTLARTQTFSSRLSGNASVSYENSRNSFLQPDDIVDTTTLGARREAISGSAGLQWQVTQRDLVSASAQGTKSNYSSPLLGDFDSYSGTLSYRRVISSRTNVGVSMSISQTNSDLSGDTTTYSPRLVLDHQFSQAWQFNGSIGLLSQRSVFNQPPFPAFRSRSKGVGFDATLCRQVPRQRLCFFANRDTSASGLGGARTATTAGANFSYTLSERETVSASASFADSKAADPALPVPKERYYSADASYRRQLSQRFDAGVTVAYRKRDLGSVTGPAGTFLSGKATGFTATLNLIAKFGRLR